MKEIPCLWRQKSQFKTYSSVENKKKLSITKCSMSKFFSDKVRSQNKSNQNIESANSSYMWLLTLRIFSFTRIKK